MSSDPRPAGELEGVLAQGGLIEYQPGSVVSRTLIKKATGTVTAFAFDAGEGLSEHTGRSTLSSWVSTVRPRSRSAQKLTAFQRDSSSSRLPVNRTPSRRSRGSR